jgi:hypothetical protein
MRWYCRLVHPWYACRASPEDQFIKLTMGGVGNCTFKFGYLFKCESLREEIKDMCIPVPRYIFYQYL